MGSDRADLQDELRPLHESPSIKRRTSPSAKGNVKVSEERQKDDADKERTNQCAEDKSGGHGPDTEAAPPPDPQRSQTRT